MASPTCGMTRNFAAGEATGFQWVMLEPGNPLAASDSSDDLSPFYSDEFPVLSREQWEKKS